MQGKNGRADCFFFSYGVCVCWCLETDEAEIMLKTIQPFEEGSLPIKEVDESEFTYGDVAKVRDGQIVLPDAEVLTKLSISYGLAQSVKLAAFETAVQKTYDSSEHIPEELSRYGHISLSRRAIRQRMGELFNVRSSINLRLDVLDSPDFFWDYPELEPLYLQVAADDELQKRLEVLNKRLSLVHEMFEMLGNELNHQHSSRLEWTIIGLIVIEVALTLLKDFIGAI
jgi:uncharacterized Rmd1/YagE family protein